MRRALADALPEAMKDRDRAKVSALRIALAAVANAEATEAGDGGPQVGVFATEVARRSLTDLDVEAIVRETRDELRLASVEMQLLGQAQRADDLADQVAALDAFLGR
ncbi:MAG: hypothetical protein R2726_14495 [Acidimicrobiales bacterium]